MPNAKIIFMGTPEIALPALQVLATRRDVDLQLVVTQPDRPAGRGKKLVAPAVAQRTEELNLPLLQTDSLRHAEVKQQIIDLKPDLVVVLAFGMILGKWILDLPTHGCVNLHASLLPKYRGASPISEAILQGESVTGVTLMQMDRGLDTGDMLASIEIPILPTDTTESLTPKLGDAAATLLDDKLSQVLSGELVAVPQPEGATETRRLTKDDGRVVWTRPAVEIERQVRAMWNWPRAWTALPDGNRLQIHAARVSDRDEIPVGTVYQDGRTIMIGTGQGALELLHVQLPGGKPIEGHALIQKLDPYVGRSLATE